MTDRHAAWIFAGALALAAVAFQCDSQLAHAQAKRVGPDSAYPPAGIGRWDKTITQANIKTTICTAGYTMLVRDGKTPGFGAITQSIKDQVYKRDGKTPDHLPAAQSHCCEIDHADPLTLGGANVIENLWAESWDKPYGARQKDHDAEDALNKLVCANKVSLIEAQACLADDWIACAVKIGKMQLQPTLKSLSVK